MSFKGHGQIYFKYFGSVVINIILSWNEDNLLNNKQVRVNNSIIQAQYTVN